MWRRRKKRKEKEDREVSDVKRTNGEESLQI